NTLTKVTSASPIISAAAVEAVRRGVRIAFSRAGRPGSRNIHTNGNPISPARGRVNSGLKIATPLKDQMTPAPTFPTRLPTSLNNPRSSSATPVKVTTRPIIVRRRIVRWGTVATSARSAATGGTRVALSAGKNDDTNVTTTPTSSATITVRASN